MDATEAAALKRLGEREVWAVDELPEGIGADLLRCLDDDGWLEARSVIMSHRGAGKPMAPVRQEWYSPVKHPSNAGGWDAILKRRIRDTSQHPFEVRVTERGRAALTRLKRREARAGESASETLNAGPPRHSRFVPATIVRTKREWALHELLAAPPDLDTDCPGMALANWLRSVARCGGPLIPARLRPQPPLMSPANGSALHEPRPDEVTACRWIDGLDAVLLRGEQLDDLYGRTIGALAPEPTGGAVLAPIDPEDDDQEPRLILLRPDVRFTLSLGVILAYTLRCAGVVLTTDRTRPNALQAWVDTARSWDAAMKAAHEVRARLADAAYTRGIRRAVPALAETFGEALRELEPHALTQARDANTLSVVQPFLKKVRLLLDQIQGQQELDERPGVLRYTKIELRWNRHQLGEALAELEALAEVPAPAPQGATAPGLAGRKTRLARDPAGEVAAPKSWEEVTPIAEGHVRRHGWSSVRALADVCGCSAATVRKATDRSTFLKAREAEAKGRGPRGRVVGLSPEMLRAVPAPQLDDTLQALLAESAHDNASDPSPLDNSRRLAKPRQRH